MTDALPPNTDDPASDAAATVSKDIKEVKARFNKEYPRIHQMASDQHRKLRGELHEEAVADTIAFAWRYYRNMALKGGDPDRLLGSIVRYSAKHVRAGKRIGHSPRASDVLTRSARGKHRPRVASLPHSEEEEAAGEVHEALQDRGPDPAEEAAAHLDYLEWLGTLSPPQRDVAEGLVDGMNMAEIAERRGVSSAAVQQNVARVRKSLAERQEGRDR